MMHYANNHLEHKFKHTIKKIAGISKPLQKQIFDQLVWFPEALSVIWVIDINVKHSQIASDLGVLKICLLTMCDTICPKETRNSFTTWNFKDVLPF